MKRLFILLFTLLGINAYSQDDPGLRLYWTEFVDSNDFIINYDTVLSIDTIVVIDSVTSEETTVIDTNFTLTPIDSSYVIKYMAYDTQSVSSQGILIYQRIRTQAEQQSILLNEIMKASKSVGALQRAAMRERAKLLSAKQYYEDFTGEANGFVAVYNTLWGNLSNATLRSTNTDVNSPYYFPVITAQPNAAGVIRDENNKLIARLFPLSNNYITVIIAKDGSFADGVSIPLYSDDGQTFISYDADSNVGRVVLRLSRKLY